MKKTFAMTIVALAIATGAQAGDKVTATLHADQGTVTINKEIYGQFAEHLGRH